MGEQTSTAEEVTAVSQLAPESLLSSVGNAVPLYTNVDFYLQIALVVLILTVYTIYSIIQRVRRKNLEKSS